MSENKYYSFRTRHPLRHLAIALLSMFSPFCLTVLALLIFKVVDGLTVLGIYALFGSLLLGGGLTLCVAADYDKEAFWRLNIYPIAIGALITLGNFFCACSQRMGEILDAKLLLFQMVCYFCVFWFLLLYAVAREAITDCIKRKTHLNEAQLDKRKKGFFNYLWYREIHEKYRIGWIYYFNIIFTTAIFLLLVGTAALVLQRAVARLVMPLCLFAATGAVVLELFVLVNGIKNKKSYYGRKKRSLLGRIPYSYELRGILSVVMPTLWQTKCYIAL